MTMTKTKTHIIERHKDNKWIETETKSRFNVATKDKEKDKIKG
jgi:hypothetical protein